MAFLCRLSILFINLIALLVLSGCATYGNNLTSALTSFEAGDFESAEQQLESALSSKSQDRLLYHMELGVVKHLQGEYAASNELLEEASRISESLQKSSLSNQLVSLMANPRQASYKGAEHERVLLYYYKAINYLAIANQLPPGSARLDALEGSRVEARRLLLRLQALRNNEGDYHSARTADQSTFQSVFNAFSVLMGNLIDKDELTYRDDALAHYITGISFEMNAEYDNARISYQTAAKSYDEGYAAQFRLGDGMVKDAWFDTARMMKRLGDDEWQTLAEDKLSPSQQDLLTKLDTQNAQVLVLEHKGTAPEKQEMNLQLAINPYLKSLNLEPYYFEHGNRNDQLEWFYMMYADKGVTTLVSNYLNATRNGYMDFYTKTLFLGPAYHQLESIGATQAIGNSLRVTVPYYAPPTQYGSSEVRSANQTWRLNLASSPQQMAIQTQMKQAGSEIRASLARASVKAITASKLAENDSSGLLAFAGKLAAQLTDAAETRSWLLLPAEIHFKRLFLDAGEHTLTLDSALENGQRQTHQVQFSLAQGDITLWPVRSLPRAQSNIKRIPNGVGTIDLSYNLNTTE